MTTRPRFLVVVLLALIACSSKPEPGPTPAAEAKPVPAAVVKTPKKPTADFSGVVRGIVKFVDGGELPLIPAPTEQVVNAAAPCPPYTEADRGVFALVPETRGISPVHVAITQMSAVPEHAPQKREVRIENCRLTPKLVGAVSGDTLRVSNLSEIPLLPLLPGDSYMQGIIKGDAREAKLGRLGPTRLRCTIAGFCGDATVITLSHSLFAVTDAKGEFEIRGVPLEQDLIIHAAHPLLGVTSTKVRVTKAQPEAKVELTVAPKAAPAAKPVESATKPESDKPVVPKPADKPAKK